MSDERLIRAGRAIAGRNMQILKDTAKKYEGKGEAGDMESYRRQLERERAPGIVKGGTKLVKT